MNAHQRFYLKYSLMRESATYSNSVKGKIQRTHIDKKDAGVKNRYKLTTFGGDKEKSIVSLLDRIHLHIYR